MKQVVTPSEMAHLVQRILADVEQHASPPAERAAVQEALAAFSERWQQCFARFGQQPAGELAYRDALLAFQEAVAPLLRPWLAADGAGAAALTSIETMLPTPAPPRRLNRQVLAQMRQQRRLATLPPETLHHHPAFDRPLFIVSAPRAGSTLLFETLAQFAAVWTIGRESHDIEADIPELHPATCNYASNRLTAAEATPAVSTAVQRWFRQRLQNRSGGWYWMLPEEERPPSVRFLEKTPKNALRIPFLKAVFPDARFIFLYREPQQTISSLMEGWRSRRFVAYRDMPRWPYQEWSFLLTPGWEHLGDRPLAEIAAQQWQISNTCIMDDLAMVPRSEWCLVQYSDLIRDPKRTIEALGQFAGVHRDHHIEQVVSDTLPVTHVTLSAPSAEKWRDQEGEIAPLLPNLEPVVRRVAGT